MKIEANQSISTIIIDNKPYVTIFTFNHSQSHYTGLAKLNYLYYYVIKMKNKTNIKNNKADNKGAFKTDQITGCFLDLSNR